MEQNVSETREAIPRNVRQWAMFVHLSALFGLLGNGIGFVLGPLVVWLIKKDDHPFIDRQGKESINFQLTMFLLLILSAILALVIIGFVLVIIVLVIMVVFPVIGAISANEGKDYKYPFSIRFIS
jgi:uncharacterized Tic20 family protein